MFSKMPETMPKEKIRVVHIITMLELGGAQQNTLYTVEHLDRRRFEVFLIAGSGGILDEDAERIADLTTFFVPSLVRPIRPFSDWKALWRIRALLRKIRPHIVHTHSSKAGIVYVRLSSTRPILWPTACAAVYVPYWPRCMWPLIWAKSRYLKLSVQKQGDDSDASSPSFL